VVNIFMKTPWIGFDAEIQTDRITPKRKPDEHGFTALFEGWKKFDGTGSLLNQAPFDSAFAILHIPGLGNTAFAHALLLELYFISG
jgi:hypothetical protein